MSFTPRMSSAGMRGNAWWYSRGNIYYPTYGLPNCTCYAYGRAAEIMGHFLHLPGGGGGVWWNQVDETQFVKAQVPALGAVICSHKRGQTHGHVAIVEQINSDGSIITSNSAWQGTYFWTETLRPENGYCSGWMTRGDYVVQGFIWLTADGGEIPDPTDPTDPLYFLTHKKRKFIYYLKKL